jgi:Mg2+/Co2+ transporter CorB
LLQAAVGDLITEAPGTQLQKDGSYLVDASISVREMNRITQWNLPTEGPKTLNGLIIEYLENIPEPGTSIKLHGHILEIVQRSGTTVNLVKFYPD